MGPRDIEKNEVLTVRRDTGTKQPTPMATLATDIPRLLTTIQADMLARATAVRDARLKRVTRWEDFVPALDGKNLLLVPWCERTACEDEIKERSGKVSSDVSQDEKAPSYAEW